MPLEITRILQLARQHENETWNIETTNFYFQERLIARQWNFNNIINNSRANMCALSVVSGDLPFLVGDGALVLTDDVIE